MSIYDLVYDSLVRINDDYEIKPWIAESWENKGKKWTFHLRQDVTFSDGTPLTANDVVTTVQYILAKADTESGVVPGYYSNLKYMISSISAPSEYTVSITAARRYVGLLYALTFPILPAAQVDMDNPLGSGAYVIGAFEAGDYLWLQANNRWWQAHPQVQEISVVMHNSQSAVMESYEYGRVDTIFSRAVAAGQYKSGNSSISFIGRTNQLEVLAMNNHSRPMDDVNARKAIRMLIDPDKIASTVYGNLVTRTDLPTIPGTWMYDDELLSSFQTNQQEAVRLLAEAGWTDSDGDGVLDKPKEDDPDKLWKLHLRLFYYEEPDNSVRADAAEMISAMLEAVGIEVEVQVMTYASIQEKLKAGSYDLALLSYAMDPVPDAGFLLMSGNTGNYFRYRSKTMTGLFDELRKVDSQESYRAKLHEIWRLYAEDLPFICLYYRNTTVLTRKMYTVVRDVRELSLLRGIESFHMN